jgi:hypothetical protein
VVGDVVDDEVGQRPAPGEGGRPVVGEDLGGVLPWGGQGDGVGVADAGLDQQLVRVAGGLDPGGVVVQRDDDVAVGERGDAVDGGELLRGQRGAQRRPRRRDPTRRRPACGVMAWASIGGLRR